MTDKQKTLKSEVVISGKGLHTGKTVTVIINPAEDNHGYKFQRTDLEGQPIIKADVRYVVDTRRGTTLEQNGARVYTTEHLLASLYGMGIDNALIQLDGPEVPIMDGSSKAFLDGILAVGIVDQKEDKDYLILDENVTYEDPEKNVEMLAVPADEFRITVMVDYNSPQLGTQHASMYHIGEFEKEISGCRTFVFLREVEQLLNAGLIKGGDVNSAIVLVDREWNQEDLSRLAALFGKPEIEVKNLHTGVGTLNNVELQYENEPARHKLLDIVGDLALIGKPIKGHILAARPGHAGNVSFGKILQDIIKKQKKQGPKYNANTKTIFDINQIRTMLPHRYPFLLIDKIIEISDKHAVSVKNVTANEEFFNGHFPQEPVMPGVLMIEAMAQTGGIMGLQSIPDPENYSTYFMKIDNVKFKQKVIPGDTLIIKVDMIGEIRRGICQMQATAYVDSKIVCEGELMAQIVKTVKETKNEPTASVHTS